MLVKVKDQGGGGGRAKLELKWVANLEILVDIFVLR